jgi:hypothetical protein
MVISMRKTSYQHLCEPDPWQIHTAVAAALLAGRAAH